MATKQEIIGSICGQKVVIPDLESIFGDRPKGRSYKETRLREIVSEHLNSVLEPGKRLKQMKGAKVETFATTWWSNATIEAFQFAAHLAIWLFLWDDDTDTPEYTNEFVDDIDASRKFREDTLAFVNQCLYPANIDCFKVPSNRIINNFRPIGEFVRSQFTDGQKKQLYHQLDVWINTTSIEQRHEVTGKLPSTGQYLKDRLGSSAVGVCLAICESMLQIDLPDIIRREEDMTRIWDCTNTIISISNDMLSFKKEIAQARIDNLVVLLYVQSGSLQVAMDAASIQVCETKMEMDEAAARLMAKYPAIASSEANDDLRTFIDCCKTMCTGNNTWSLASDCYLLNAKSFKGGIEVQL